MNPHFFTAPFCFAFVSAMKMVFPYPQPSPLGEGAPQGRIG